MNACLLSFVRYYFLRTIITSYLLGPLPTIVHGLLVLIIMIVYCTPLPPLPLLHAAALPLFMLQCIITYAT